MLGRFKNNGFRILDKEHADMARGIAKEFKKRGYKTRVEMPYDYYDERGFVDVVAWNNDELLACELKPLLINISETLKQVNQTRDSFLQSHPNLAQSLKVRYPLVLRATTDNLNVCEAYLDLLKDADIIFWHEDKEIEVGISQRYKEYVERGVPTNIIVTNVCTICRDAIDNGALCDYCRKMLGFR